MVITSDSDQHSDNAGSSPASAFFMTDFFAENQYGFTTLTTTYNDDIHDHASAIVRSNYHLNPSHSSIQVVSAHNTRSCCQQRDSSVPLDRPMLVWLMYLVRA